MENVSQIFSAPELSVRWRDLFTNQQTGQIETPI